MEMSNYYHFFEQSKQNNHINTYTHNKHSLRIKTTDGIFFCQVLTCSKKLMLIIGDQTIDGDIVDDDGR